MPDQRQTLRALRFRDLMPYRVAEVLLVSSPYDAFILEQDGQLTEQVFLEYTTLKLPSAPRFTHAPSGEAALEMLRARHFDLVLTMTSLADVDVNAFGRQVKTLKPGRPVVLLALDRKELHDLRDKIDPEVIDGAFLWSGDPKILFAIMMYVEDRQNIEHDIEHGKVRVIIVVEDSPYYYSSFLGLLYRELVRQARSLYAEGVNEILRQMYMKSRPKILLARSYEEGVELLKRYRRFLLALICDVGLPRAGKLDEDASAGLDLVRQARRVEPDLPVLVQSAEAKHAADAAKLDGVFIDKGSPSLLAEIRKFVTEELGFGDFVFRDSQGKELGRARDLRELLEVLGTIPEESIAFHALHNHFSIWLMARSELRLAELIRPRTIADFQGVEGLRTYLTDVLKKVHLELHRGVVSDFNRRDFERELFSRLGVGSLGGKARGLAFLNLQLADLEDSDFDGLPVKMPKTVVIAVDHFDKFLDENDLRDFVYTCEDDREMVDRFLNGQLNETLTDDLRFIVERLDGPLAVRSSSLLEDSLHQPLAGIYATVMLPNHAEDPEERLRELAAALKLIYASTFLSDAKAYLHSTGHRVEEEKMGVIIQPLVGRRHDRRFYPTFSGVAQSFNYYPLAPQKAEDGIAYIALGLGRQIVDGGVALRFSPSFPEMLPQLADPATFLDQSQRGFYALDMDHDCCAHYADLDSSVRRFGLEAAERDGTLVAVGSVFSADDRQIREDLTLSGPRIVTFNNILKHRAIPLAPAVKRLLEVGTEGFGGPVEIELAVEMGDWLSGSKDGESYCGPELYVLQIRPLAGYDPSVNGGEIRFAPEDRLCMARRSLGNGVEDQLHDLIYVCPDRWQAADNKTIAQEIGKLNEELVAAERPYVLIGPGRWGTADEWLGIPVRWAQISGARVIVEASPAGYHVEPSQGTHFFQNITSLGIGYLSLPPGVDDLDGEGEDGLDQSWLAAQPSYRETTHLRWLRFDEPLMAVLDGRRGRGVIAKPGAAKQ